MPLLKVEANKLTLPSLQLGVVQVIITRGAREVLSQLPFKPFEGESYAFNQEKTLPTDNSAGDPYGVSTLLPGGVGTRRRQAVESGYLRRNIDTAKIDVIGKSDKQSQRDADLIMGSKKLAKDFVSQFINGVPDTTGSTTDFNLRGIEYWLGFYETDFPDQKVYGTNTGEIDGTPANLSLRMVDDMLSRHFGGDFDAIYSDRATQVAFKNLYNLAGGNTGAMFMEANFGLSERHTLTQRVFMYDGKPWYVLDEVGAAKSSTSVAISSGDNTLTVSDVGDPGFIGFSDIDVGRAVVVPGAGASAADLETTIASVTSNRVVELEDAAGTTVSGVALTSSPVNVIYAVRYDEEDGFTTIFHKNQSVPADPGEYFGPIAGFNYENLGTHPDYPIIRGRVDWYGNFVNHSPYSIVRLSRFVA